MTNALPDLSNSGKAIVERALEALTTGLDPLTLQEYIAVGSNPAQSGAIRLSPDSTIGGDLVPETDDTYHIGGDRTARWRSGRFSDWIAIGEIVESASGGRSTIILSPTGNGIIAQAPDATFGQAFQDSPTIALIAQEWSGDEETGFSQNRTFILRHSLDAGQNPVIELVKNSTVLVAFDFEDDVVLPTLPTSDPVKAGALWVDVGAGRVVKQSAG